MCGFNYKEQRLVLLRAPLFVFLPPRNYLQFTLHVTYHGQPWTTPTSLSESTLKDQKYTRMIHTRARLGIYPLPRKNKRTHTRVRAGISTHPRSDYTPRHFLATLTTRELHDIFLCVGACLP